MNCNALKFPMLLIGLGIVIIAAGNLGAASAQHCETMPLGPERTDCFIAQTQLAGAKANADAAAARVQTDAAVLRTKTGTSGTAKARRVRRGSRPR